MTYIAGHYDASVREKGVNVPSFAIFRSIERRFPWSFLGFLAGVIFGLFGIYTVFFYNKTADLKAEILSFAPVLSIRENVQDLEILFKGQNIKQTRNALTLVNLKLINIGNIALKPGDFDQKDLLAICLTDGEFVNSDILERSDPYLDKVFAETTKTPQRIAFPPFIMEPSHFMSLKLLILHNESVTPTLTIKGKVANVPKIPIVGLSETAATRSAMAIALSGGLLIQFIRIGLYGIGAVILFLIILIPSIVIIDKAEDHGLRRRKRRIELSVNEYLQSLDQSARHILEPIAGAIIAEDRWRDIHQSIPKGVLRAIEKGDAEKWNHQDIEKLFKRLKINLSQSDREYFLKSQNGMTQLIDLVAIFIQKH